MHAEKRKSQNLYNVRKGANGLDEKSLLRGQHELDHIGLPHPMFFVGVSRCGKVGSEGSPGFLLDRDLPPSAWNLGDKGRCFTGAQVCQMIQYT